MSLNIKEQCSQLKNLLNAFLGSAFPLPNKTEAKLATDYFGKFEDIFSSPK